MKSEASAGTGNGFSRKVSVRVAVEPQGYEIGIGYGIIPDIVRAIIMKRYGSRIAIITDSNVRPLYGDEFVSRFRQAGIDTCIIDFPAGETYKTHRTKTTLDEALLEQKFPRDGLIIALGGGVVGDVAGFVAATYMRGVAYVQIPTSVIAQVDSSIGGKTAVDYPQGKNLIGAFHHPRAVFMDIKMLQSLDDRNYRNGLIEMVKHGLIRDTALFEFIENHVRIILDREHPDFRTIMVELMARNMKVKNDVVSIDPKEKNLRKILNYGHTIGHAVEHLSGYSLLHGEAVAIGIAAEAYFARALGFCREEDFRRQLRIIDAIGLPRAIPLAIPTDSIIETMTIDKKSSGNTVRIVLLRRIGKVRKTYGGRTVHPVERDQLRKLIEDFRQMR